MDDRRVELSITIKVGETFAQQILVDEWPVEGETRFLAAKHMAKKLLSDTLDALDSIERSEEESRDILLEKMMEVFRRG